MLQRSGILVVEDEPFIALDLALAIEDAGGEPIGPAASIKEALNLLTSHSVAGAILDVNLVDGEISPVVEHLMALGIPLILQTGVGLTDDLAARFPNLIVRIKPVVSSVLVAQLETLITSRTIEGDKSADLP